MSITPTIGRIVLFRPKDEEFGEDARNAAIVAHVYDNGKVNLAVANIYGVMESEQNVTLVQEGEEPAPGQCEWPIHSNPPIVINSPLRNLLDESEEAYQSNKLAEEQAAGKVDATNDQDADEDIGINVLEPSTSISDMTVHADDFELIGVDYLDSAGGMCIERMDVCTQVRYLFIDGAVFVLTKEESETLDNFAFITSDVDEEATKEAG